MSEELIMMGWLFSRVTSLSMVRWTLPSGNRLRDIHCLKYKICLPELINSVLIIIKCLYLICRDLLKQATICPPTHKKTQGVGEKHFVKSKQA